MDDITQETVNNETIQETTEIEPVSYISLYDDVKHPIDAITLDGKSANDFLDKNSVVDVIDENSTNSQYPSAKAVWDAINNVTDVEIQKF